MTELTDQFARISQALQNNDQQQALQLLEQLPIEMLTQISELDRLAQIAVLLQNHSLALRFYNQAFKLEPQNDQICNNLGHLHFVLNKRDQAEDYFKKAMALNPHNQEAAINLSLTFEQNNQTEQAITTLTQLLKQQPDSDAAYARLATLYERRLEFDKANQAIDHALNINPQNQAALLVRITLLRRDKKFDEALQLVDKLIQNDPQADYFFEKAYLLEKTKQYPQAFEAFNRAHQIKNPKSKTKEDFLKTINSLKTSYSNITQNHRPKTPRINHHWPIFILGCMRSGTTLVAEMVGAHTQCHNEGELNLVHQVFDTALQKIGPHLSLADFGEQLWRDDNQELIVELQNKMKELMTPLPSTQNKLWPIDKMPDNAMALSLITKVMPGAPVIMVIRDGREMALSSFRQNFRAEHWHVHNLQDSLTYWEHTIDLVRNAAENLKFPYYEIFYEKLVTNPKEELKKLLDFLHLDWQEDCLNFHQSQSQVHTASFEQVKQPVYKGSIDFAKKNYPEVYEQMTKMAEGKLKELGYNTTFS